MPVLRGVEDKFFVVQSGQEPFGKCPSVVVILAFPVLK